MQQPSPAFILASWAALIIGVAAILIGLWNSEMGIEEKGYYLAVLSLGLFSSVSIQKAVRDRVENIPVTDQYLGICWFAIILSLSLIVIGLYNTTSMALSEKGFYAMAFVLSIYASITVQKNIRDKSAANSYVTTRSRFENREIPPVNSLQK